MNECGRSRVRLHRLAALLAVIVLIVGCGPPEGSRSSSAPRDWAASRGLETGAPAGPQGVPPANVSPGAEDANPEATRAAIWTSVSMVVLTALLAVTGVFLLESRRRVRRDARRIEHDVVRRANGDPALRGIRLAVVARTPLWRGPIQLDVEGTVASDTQREAVVSIARDRAAKARRPVRVNDAVHVRPPTPPSHHGEVA